MIRTTFITSARFTLAASAVALLFPATRSEAQNSLPSAGSSADGYADTRYSADQLDNLVSAVALYPDALLAQVLVAATFPDQVEDAAVWVRAHGTDGIDDQYWDISVKSVAHYPSALNMLADKLDWTATLGRAYAYQSADVMLAVQRLRGMAAEQGNLESSAQQRVVRENNYFIIAPANPRVIYVPVYDPILVYTRPIFALNLSSRYWSFGVGFPIGGWLSYDLDWGRRAVYYNGWEPRYYGLGGGWRGNARPYVNITNVYVNPRYRTVYVNRSTWNRGIDYRNVDRYARIHPDAWFDRNRSSYGERRDRNRDSGNGRNDDNRGRTGTNGRGFNDNAVDTRRAQPRSAQGVATPEGYRRPTIARVERGRPVNTAADAGGGTVRVNAASPTIGSQRGERGGANANGSRSFPSASEPVARPRTDVRQRAEPQRAAAQRAEPQRAPTQRAEPQRAPTQRAEPQRAPAQRAEPQRTAKKRPPGSN